MPANYSGQNLRGRSFKGQNLEGADFSRADIRGADFTGANLQGANFSKAKAGLQKRWMMVLALVSFLLVGIFGLLPAFTGYSASLIFSSVLGFQLFGWFSLLINIAVIAIIIRQGINIHFVVAVAIIFAFTLVLAFIFAFVVASFSEIGVNFGVGIFRIISSEAVAGFFVFILLSIYIVLQAMKGDEKYVLVRSAAITFASFGGTSFRKANLTDANFSQAILKSTDFRDADLTRTCFQKAKKLDRARPGKTYLQNYKLLQVLISGQGQEKNFDRLDLRGVNLQGVFLNDASFIAADLSDTNFQDADLSRAFLVQAQLDNTDFTGADLTGAYIEDWNITSSTKFNGVRCEYVYMRQPTKDNPDPHRKPDNRQEVFGDGEFTDFIKPIVDTLDLYHNSGVDPRAIAISFKQLAENHPDAELRIVGMEVKGGDKLLLRAETATNIDKSELSAEYFDTYNYIKTLPDREVKLLLAEKDSRIRSLETMVNTALQSPKFYANNYNNQGDTMPQSPQKQSNFNLQGAQFGGGLVNAETVNAHQIGGNIINNPKQPTETKNSPAKTILILAANPRNTSTLRLDEEVREIDAGLQRAKKRELFDLKQRWAVRVQDVYQALLDFKPQIVHFSGHGVGEDGLVFEDEAGNLKLVDTQALAQLFELFSGSLECVVLNACYSEVQADAIVKYIPYVIGMNKQIGDKAAIKFATGFYSAVGAGESVEFAYKLGCNVIQLDGISEHLTPVIRKR